MNPIYVRPLRTNDPADAAAFAALADGGNRFYPRNVFTLPTTDVMVAEKIVDGKPEPILYQPFYVSLVMGSFVGMGSPGELAQAQKMLTAAAYTRAHAQSMADIMVLSVNDETLHFGARHGFERAHTALRMDIR
jgi:hypothetical protein